MPKILEAALKAAAKRKGMRAGSERYNRYVYGTLNKVKSKEQSK